ncbi:MAG: hydroxyacylglutathione hydrolase [Coxiellaceae bacterium]|nr:hydroxyacylglutathione hydrolase [Coxiellaceae bacterium]
MIQSIFPISAFNDNYIWVWVDDVKKQAIVVDPGDAAPVLNFLQEKGLTLQALLITHKHHDHTGGISALLSEFPEALVFSHPTENIAQTTHIVMNGDVIKINDHEFRVIHIPGHTLGHVAYYCNPMLFCGDTLFTNGCGRLFEGTAEQMLTSLKKLMVLPDDTQVYCGHEYTLSNIKFALQVEPNNQLLKKRFEDAKQLRFHNKPTVPSLLKLEKDTNPFLRCHTQAVINSASEQLGKPCETEVDVFYALREWKNYF